MEHSVRASSQNDTCVARTSRRLLSLDDDDVDVDVEGGAVIDDGLRPLRRW